MKILHIIDINNIKGNGVAHAVEQYIKYESKNNSVVLFSLSSRLDNDDIKEINYKEKRTITDIIEITSKPDIIVFNEVYKKKYLSLYKECIRIGIPYVIIPHGCLVKESQKEKRLKKIIGNVLLFNRFIRKASAIQFLNNQEKENSRFKYNKAIISGNGIKNEKGFNKPHNKNLVYIGRYSIFVKGLDLLVELCSSNREWFINNKVKVNLYGRDASNNLMLLKNMIEENNISDIIEINDAVFAEEKEKILENTYCFIQLSRHEGQPMGIIEALSYGIPCIVTYGTTFGEFVNNNSCGIGCDFSSETIFNAIKRMNNDKIRNAMSKNAKEKVRNEFDWDIIINKLMVEYSKLVKGE